MKEFLSPYFFKNMDISEKIKLVNEATLESLRDKSEDAIIKKFTDVGLKILRADFGFGWYKTAGQDDFNLAYKSPKMPYTPTKPRKKSGVNAMAQAKKEPVFIQDVTRAGFVKKDAYNYMRGVTAIPMVYKNKTYGNIILCYKNIHNFSSQEKILCAAVGHSAAQAITINRLNRNLKREKENLEQRVLERTQELIKTNGLLKREIAQRRQTQKQLEESRHFIEQITNVVPGLITVIDLKTGQYIYINDTVKKVLGYSRQEFFSGGTAFVTSLVHHEDVNKIATENAAALKKANKAKIGDLEPIVVFEYRVRHKNGGYKWLNTYGVVFDRDSNGKVTRILNISVDITDRKIIEEQLQQREKLLRNAQVIARLGSWEWNVAENRLFWSDEMAKIYGVKKSKIRTYDHFQNLIHEADRAMVAKKIQQAFDHNANFDFYHRIVRPTDGAVRTLHARGEVVVSGDGKVLKMLGTGQDVTEQQEAENTLRAYTKELETAKSKIESDQAKDQAIINNIGEGIVATNKDAQIILINPQAKKLLDWENSDVLGKNIWSVFPLLDEQGKPVNIQDRPMYKSLRHGKAPSEARQQIYYYAKKNGGRFPLAVTATPIKVKGRVEGAIQVIRDVSKEREIDRVKSELISLASHQLRTPLSAINWYTEALIKEEVGKLGREQKKYLRQINHANQRMVELVYDFLNVSRIELGTFSMKLSTFNPVEITEGILREITPLIQQKNLQVKQKFGKALQQVEGDRKVVRLILQNLITNAVKYTQNRGKISIALSLKKRGAGKNSLYICVADNGYGIPRDQQPKIFTKMFRAENTAKLDTEGSGLGLYLVKSFVDFCKGKISFTSKENKGSSFFVTLPIRLPKKVEK